MASRWLEANREHKGIYSGNPMGYSSNSIFRSSTSTGFDRHYSRISILGTIKIKEK